MTDGTLERNDDRDVVRFDRRLEYPRERVWEALTRPEQIRGWLAEAELSPVTGGRVWLRWLNAGAGREQPTATGIVTAFDPPTLLEYVTSLHGPLRFELASDPGGCRLTFTNMRSGRAEDPAELLAGWHVHLDFLERVLAGNPVDWANWPAGEFHALHERYRSVTPSR